MSRQLSQPSPGSTNRAPSSRSCSTFRCTAGFRHISLFIAGHYYKIVPFLVWYHRFGPLVGTRKVPKVSELYSERIATLDAALLVAGCIALGAGVYARSLFLTRIGAIAFAIGAVIEVIVIVGIARKRPT